MKIGFIGLGNLGAVIAENIVSSGRELAVYNRTASKTKALTDKGAKAYPSVKALAENCDIILSIVSDDAALKSVSEELLNSMKAGGIHVSMSTILPQTAEELAAGHTKNGLHYVAAPVFGRPEAARARKLNFVLSGEEKIRKIAEPILKDGGGAGVWDFGESITAANTIKLCGNFMIAAAMEAIGESVGMAEKAGLDTQKMWNFFTQTIFNSPIYINYGTTIVNKAFEPAAFTAQLGLKDMKLVNEQARQLKQPAPLANLLQQHMEYLVNNGQAHLDWSAVATAAK
jgi:3-hydroxyisobutyrate dehydrogenase and related beta-hydroxyacid dehydrogenases